jgi:hypothetical protein
MGATPLEKQQKKPSVGARACFSAAKGDGRRTVEVNLSRSGNTVNGTGFAPLLHRAILNHFAATKEDTMSTNTHWLKQIALGAAGGLAGTFALQASMTAAQKWLPQATPPLRQDPGQFMVEKAEDALPEAVHQRIPRAVETGAARTLAMGYGVTFGALYAALRPRGGNPFLDGAVLGVACWAAGYMGWLPAPGLMPPVWRQNAPQAVAPVVEHVAYGVAAVAAYDWLRERV